jgi:hypothetical protein
MKHVRKFESFLNEGSSLNEEQTYKYPGDNVYVYRVNNGKWETKKTGGSTWIDVSKYPSTVAKLNKKFPAATKSVAVKTTDVTKKTSAEPSSWPKTYRGNADSSPYNQYKTPAVQKDTFLPYSQNTSAKIGMGELEDNLKELFNQGYVKALKNALLDSHKRAFVSFLGLKDTPMTEKDFTVPELQSIQDMINLNKRQKKFSSGSNFNFYDASNRSIKAGGGTEKIKFSEKNLGVNQKDPTELSTKIALTLGMGVVTETPTSYIIDDIYDFNNYYEHPERYTIDSFPETFKNAMKKIVGGNLVQGIEETVSVLHKLGYPGYPVKITIPKNVTIKG